MKYYVNLVYAYDKLNVINRAIVCVELEESKSPNAMEWRISNEDKLVKLALERVSKEMKYRMQGLRVLNFWIYKEEGIHFYLN